MPLVTFSQFRRRSFDNMMFAPNASMEQVTERLYVDVDETLVFHDGCCGSDVVLSEVDDEIWDFDFNHPLLKNFPLAKAVIKWQREDPKEREVVVWSANHEEWVVKAANIFFKGIIPLAGIGRKKELYGTVRPWDCAIDDRTQDMRWYLDQFEEVFSPDEFIKLME